MGMSERSAVVTGSSSGIGRAIAVRLAGDGFDVVLGDVRPDPITGGDTTEQVIGERGGSCVYVQSDVSLERDCERLVEAAVERAGSLDVLVNNAVLAGAHSKSLLDTEPANWDAMMAVNLRGPYLLCRAAVRQMLGQPLVGDARGRIINITSQHGMVGAPPALAPSPRYGRRCALPRPAAAAHPPPR